MKILACQISIPDTRSIGNRISHIDRVGKLIEKKMGREGPVDLIVLPELSTIEYSRKSFERLPVLAEDLKGPSYEVFSTLATRVGSYIAYGIPRCEGGRYYVSQVVVNPEGEYVTHYDKLHIAQFGASCEKEFFTPGNKLGIFTIGNFHVGIIICYDFRFPRLTATMAEKSNLDLIIHPVAFTQDSTLKSWHPFVICRALENQIYFLSQNRAGTAWGSTIFCPPWIDDESKPYIFGFREEIRVFHVDPGTLASVRERYPLAKDKISDYAKLTY
jgi:predicted amidohydrolase